MNTKTSTAFSSTGNGQHGDETKKTAFTVIQKKHLGVNLTKEYNSGSENGKIFLAVLLLIANKWGQSKCPSTDE